LLLRVYDPERGAIFINGINIRELSLEDYYSRIAVLTQEFADFKLRTDEVISLGDTQRPIDIDRVVEAARSANAAPFIEAWEDGYQSQIGREYGGKELSGGERQRMAIARVFYRDAGFIILDEPTSAVDAIAEQEIFESLYKSSPNKTLLTISHRFSTVRQSDLIIVLELGEVQEQGTHAELVEKKGRYWELYSAQASAYND
jgi:ATP-binding cassette subfamily B protein